MAIKHIPDGQDFGPEHFPKDFGFHGSAAKGAKGRREHAGRNPKPVAENEDHEMVEEPGEAPGMAHGGAHHLHPHGHHVTGVEHDHASGGVIHHHAHGGYTLHHADGNITHHDARGGHIGAGHDGGEATHPGEGTYLAEHARGGTHADPDEAQDKALVEKGIRQHENHEHGGEHTDLHLARGGFPSLPRKMKPKAARHHSEIGTEMAVNRPPRNPAVSRTPPNTMPGGVMGMGVQPSDEPDAAGSGQGIPQLKRGGRKGGKNGGY